MNVLRTTLTLYLETAKDAVGAFRRTLFALGFLLVAGITMTIAGMMLGSTGFAGGLILGLLQCLLIGTYLALLEIGVSQKRTVRLDDITENIGSYFNRTLSVGFALSLPALILNFISPPLSMLWVILTALAFNPAVEMIYQGRSDDFMEIFRRCLDFLSHNWPEWFVAHVPILAPFALLYSVLTAPALVVLILSIVQIYSPHYGFFSLGQIASALLRSGALGIALGLLLLSINHFVMVYRGLLYQRLSRSNRRARAWQARAEGR